MGLKKLILPVNMEISQTKPNSKPTSEISQQGNVIQIPSEGSRVFEKDYNIFVTAFGTREITYEIIKYLNFREILMLRLVSQGFSGCILMLNMQCKILSDKIKICFSYRSIFPNDREILELEKNKTKKAFHINAQHGLKFASENEIEKTLCINSQYEMSELENIVKFKKTEFNKFNVINFSFGGKTLTTVLTTIAQNNCTQLTKLIIPNVEGLNFPTLSNITGLRIQCFDKEISLNTLSSLKSLFIGEVKVPLTIGNSLVNLEKLSISTLFNRLTIEEAVQNLESLNIHHLQNVVQLTNSLPKLTSLDIQEVGFYGEIKLLKSLPGLTHFSFKKNEGFALELPEDIDTLTDISLGEMREGQEFNLPKNLNKLKSFACNFVTKNISAGLANFLQNLTSFSCMNIDDENAFNLLSSLTNLKQLTIGTLMVEALCIAMRDITNFSIDCIEEGSCFDISNLFALSRVTIGSIEENATLKLEGTLEFLTHLDVGCISDGGRLTIGNKLNNLISLKMGLINKNASFKLEGTLDNLTHLDIVRIQIQVTLVNFDDIMTFKMEDLVPKLKSLHYLTIQKIGFLKNKHEKINLNLPFSLENLIIRKIKNATVDIGGKTKELPNLRALNIGEAEGLVTISPSDSANPVTSITIENIKVSGILELKGSFKNLTTLTIKSLEGNSKLRIMNSLENLKTLEFEYLTNETASDSEEDSPEPCYLGAELEIAKIGSLPSLETLIIGSRTATIEYRNGHKIFCIYDKYLDYSIKELLKVINAKH